MVLNITWRPSKKFSPRISTTCPPTSQPSFGWICLIIGVGISDSKKIKNSILEIINYFSNLKTGPDNCPKSKSEKDVPPSIGSSRLVRLPCLELLWTNILSDTANNGGSRPTVVDKTT